MVVPKPYEPKVLFGENASLSEGEPFELGAILCCLPLDLLFEVSMLSSLSRDPCLSGRGFSKENSTFFGVIPLN